MKVFFINIIKIVAIMMIEPLFPLILLLVNKQHRDK
jgi:hypothetical protein